EVAQSFIDLIYETADGHVSVAVMQDKEWQAFAKAVDQPALLEDPRFLTASLRDQNKDDRLNAMQAEIRNFTTRDIIDRLEANDVPCAPVLTRREMIRHPQIAANELVVDYEHPQSGQLRFARHPAQFSKTPTSVRHPAPVLGNKTREVLGESGFSQDEIVALEEAGAAFQAAPDDVEDAGNDKDTAA
ncbi:MAG: CoA transferase, partial [Hyphomicrobiaceae bacterium]